MAKDKKLTLQSTGGCIRLVALFGILILLFSFLAQIVSTSGARVKISHVTIDARGATLGAELYYPAGTSDRDNLPAVLVAHGGGVNAGVMRGIAEEIARRGYVVLNVDSYASGISEQPLYDDGGQGVEEYSAMATAGGMLDALNFLRTLQFVDQTRIGMVGHSMGSRRTAYAAMLDCGYLTFNDTMLNVLDETFGKSLSAQDIHQDADQLAQTLLNADQLAHYESIRAQRRTEYDTRVKSLCLIGTEAHLISVPQPVLVAGHEVMRNCQVNFAVLTGTFDFNYVDYPNRETTMEYWLTNEAIQPEIWYSLNDATGTSEKLGGFFDPVTQNEVLRNAIDQRTTRICKYNTETHSKNFFSAQMTSDAVAYFQQTLYYNGGELSAADAAPVAASSVVFFWRELWNFLAMLCMIGLLLSLAGLLLRSRFFAPCVAPSAPTPGEPVNKKSYWLFAAVTVALTYVVMYLTNKATPFMFPVTRWLPLFGSFWMTLLLVALLAVVSLILLACYALSNKKRHGTLGLERLHFLMKPSVILKAVLMGCILLAAGYFSLTVIRYLFLQDYRLWMAAFAEMKVEYWGFIWRLALLALPFYLAIGAATNYSVRDDLPVWREMTQTVVINSLGVWLCALTTVLLAYGGILQGDLFSSFISTYGMLIFVPITVVITRTSYRLTNSIWLGAVLNSLIISWTIVSTSGLNIDFFYGQTLFSNFFGA